MKNLHKTAVVKKMNDPKRLQRIEDSQVKNQRGGNVHRDHGCKNWREEISDLDIPKAPAVIPFMGCWLIQEKPAKTMADLRNMLEVQKKAEVQWFPEEYKLRGTLSFVSDDNNFKCIVEFRIFQHPQKEESYICHCTTEFGTAVAEENMQAFEDVWTLASKNFTEAYVPDYDDSLFVYQEKAFEEEVAAAS